MLSQDQRNQLLQLARKTIEAGFEGRRYEPDAAEIDDTLRKPSGAFVTLTEHEELRGCIGSITPVAPLYQAVASSAISAAFRDPRFHPLQRDELPQIHI